MGVQSELVLLDLVWFAAGVQLHFGEQQWYGCLLEFYDFKILRDTDFL
jgi:hypothetical protein